ncbi:MAG TPA: glutamate-1-semialdehyde 2,1-aminomutase [Thermoleophilaceae bacterium]|nr:glutamate-1-semialdehyde 2,1-aminomutase [Thermoleophilaceae bacterium]
MGSGARGIAASTRSAEVYERALGLLPGGVNSPVRAMQAIGRDPLFVARGEGAELTDVDGNRYVDWVMSWGPLIAGHAHPEVVAAVETATAAGTSFGAPTEAEVELAAEVVARIPSAEMVRMTSSGTEAAMSAVRLARAATGRDRVVKFAGAYHGHVDGLLADAGSGLATARGAREAGHRAGSAKRDPASSASGGIPASPGVTEAQAADTTVVPWNDRAAVEQALAQGDVAALLCEPYPANMGLVPPEDGFLAFLREASAAVGTLLMFDEVITGFRVAAGGAQERERATPDLTVLGKVIGGGLPAAAYAGPRELMERVAPAGDVYQAGTLSGNPLATAAGLATLRLLDEDAYQRLDLTTRTLADGLEEIGRGLPVTVSATTGLVTLFFSEVPVRDYDGARACDLEAYAAFCRAMLERGVYLPPSQFEAWFPSLAHDESDLRHTLEAADEALHEALG